MSFETVRRVGDFGTAVLTFMDESGYPHSVRCRAEPGGDSELVRVHIPSGVPVAPRPAGLLCHSHDRELWNQRSFTARGRMLLHSGAWMFFPENHVEGLGKGGPARLRDEVDLETLNRDLRGMVRDTLQPASASVCMRDPSGEWS